MRASALAMLAFLGLLAPRAVRAQDTPPRAPPNQDAPAEGEAAAPDVPTESVALERPKPNQGHFIALGFHGMSVSASR
jgi:hypothetical protein